MMKGKGLLLVTGAAKRIGREIAIHGAKTGWDVVIHCNTSLNEAEDTAAAIRALRRNAYVIQADLTDPTATDALIPSITRKIGPLTALVNNASLFERDLYDPDGARHNQINFKAPCVLAEQLFRERPNDTGKAIVNMLDAGPVPKIFSSYLASKEKLRAATFDMAKRMAPHTRVNAVALGPTLINPRESREHFDKLVASTPLGIEIPAQAVAASVLFLIENPAITGEVLNVDGGAHLPGSST